jgi:hypothetical protein
MANRRRPRRGQPGPDVLVDGGTGAYAGAQGGARKLKEAWRESGDLESREFGVPEADLPGGIRHVVNPETVQAKTVAPPERPADYHKYHGVPSDDGLYETPDPEITRAARPAPVPKLHDAVPVFIVEGLDGRVRREVACDSVLVSGTALGAVDPVRLCGRDENRVDIRLLNEDAANNLRIGSYSELAEGRGSMLPAVTNTYTTLTTQDELFALPAVAGTTAKVSLIITTEVPA